MKITIVMKRVFSMSLIICLVALSGCGGSDGKMEVKGTVSYGGQPIEDGVIVFMPPPNESGASESFIIKGGAFTGRLPEGKRNVQIHGFRLGTEPVVDSMTGESSLPKEQYVPGVYNVQTQLSVDVVADMTPLVFDLDAIAIPEGNRPPK